MTIFKCKMCGAGLEIVDGVTIVECKYCGTRQTVSEDVAEVVIERVMPSANVSVLLKRMYSFLEDGEWASAKEYSEKILNLDPECAEAYLGKLMAELNVRTKEKLKDRQLPFDERKTYKKLIQFADASLKRTLEEYIVHIKERNEIARLEAIYTDAKKVFCDDKFNAGIKDYKRSAAQFYSIKDYKDSEELAKQCLNKASKIKKKDRIIASIVITTIALFIGFVVLSFTYIIPENKYNKAVALMENGQYLDAMYAFKSLKPYRDSEAKEKECYAEHKSIAFKSIKVGDTVMFGSYEQDNKLDNGKECIEWIVLDIKYGKALLISKHALDFKPYNEHKSDVTWETCTLRNWLNNEFFSCAFSSEEAAAIPTVVITMDKNPSSNTNSGNSTADRVFVLNVEEAKRYFANDASRICYYTEYAKKQSDSLYYSINNTCKWWLRTPGFSQNHAACIATLGYIATAGSPVQYTNVAVRPALWIDLSKVG